MKENSNYTEPHKFNVDTSISHSDGILSTEIVVLNSDNDNACLTSSIPKGSKKRIRKRTHKKKDPILKPCEIFENVIN